MRKQYLISTDLDGTLLDHHTYSWAAAKPALDRCNDLNVAVILNTSKTQAEVEVISQDLQLDSPMIVENGSALLIPSQLVAKEFPVPTEGPKITFEESYLRIQFGTQRNDILDFIELTRANRKWDFEGFNDWTVAQIAKRTGLSLIESEGASQKNYSEPLVWNDSDENLSEFQRLAESAGFQLVRGGRFYHLQGPTDKAKPLLWLKQNAAQLMPNLITNSQPTLICLGDNQNDVAMLNIADIPICVRSPIADFPTLTTDRPIIQTNEFGPEGWNQAILELLQAIT